LACRRNEKIEHQGTAQGSTQLRRAHLWSYVTHARDIRIVYQSLFRHDGRKVVGDLGVDRK